MINTSAGNRRSRHVRVLVGAILLGGLLFQCLGVLTQRDNSVPAVIDRPVLPVANAAFASPVSTAPRVGQSLEERAARDPIGFVEEALEQYDRTVRDYTCTFTKQEMIGGKLGLEQVTNAMFREKPFSVRLEWIKNADKCDRVLYVADRWVKDNQQMAVVEPGALARLFVSYVMRPIHGADAMKSSRRTIDQFGLRNAMVLVLKYVKLSQQQGILDFSFKGVSQVEGRDTLVFERHLPYAGEDGAWPDRVLVFHLDRELLLPTLCLCYSDEAKTVLLGKYMNTNIKLNPGLPDSTFTKAGMGL